MVRSFFRRTSSRVLKSLAGILGAGIIALGIATGLFLIGAFDREDWDRDTPLPGPVAVKQVSGGVIILADDRAYQLAGVTRREGVSPGEFDAALRTVAAQGVIVDRDLGDGRAFLRAEPKFYNHCGYRDRWGRHFAGRYVNCDASLALVAAGYARVDVEQPGLTDLDRWRLDGLEHLINIPTTPQRISDRLAAFEMTAEEHYLAEYDEALELIWKPPPR